jgi:hypothetical protein
LNVAEVPLANIVLGSARTHLKMPKLVSMQVDRCQSL